MQLTWERGQPGLRARHLGARTLKATRLDVDLADSYPVYPERSVRDGVTALSVLLGIDGSMTRYLDAAVWGAGVDWAFRILDQPLPAEGAKLTGHAIVDAVQRACEHRAADLNWLDLAAQGFALLGEEDYDALREQAAALVDSIRVVPMIYVDGATLTPVPLYESDDLLAIAALEQLTINQQGLNMNVCHHCARPFLPVNRADEAYCRRSAPGEALGTTCQEVGPQRRYAAGLDVLAAAYRRHYKRLDLRARRSRITREQLDDWRELAKALLETGQRRRWGLKRFEEELMAIEPKGEFDGAR